MNRLRRKYGTSGLLAGVFPKRGNRVFCMQVMLLVLFSPLAFPTYSQYVSVSGNIPPDKSNVILYNDFSDWEEHPPMPGWDMLAASRPKGGEYGDWINQNKTGADQEWVEGSGSRAYHNLNSFTHDSWLITPEIQVNANTNYVLSFEELKSHYSKYHYFGVYISIEGSEFTQLEEFNEDTPGPIPRTKNLRDTNSGLEDMGAYKIRLAFVYNSPDGTMGHRQSIYYVEVREVFSADVTMLDPEPLDGGLVFPLVGSPSVTFDSPGQYQEIIASPAYGFGFSHWNVNEIDVIEARHTLIIDQDYTVQGFFEAYSYDSLHTQDTYSGDSEPIGSGSRRATAVSFPQPSEVSKLVLHGSPAKYDGSNLLPWTEEPAEYLDFEVRIYREADINNPTEPSWDNPQLYFSNLKGRMFDTQENNVLNNSFGSDLKEKVYKVEIDIPSTILEGDFYISVELIGNESGEWFFWLHSTSSNVFALSWNEDNTAAQDHGLMLELWGRKVTQWIGEALDGSKNPDPNWHAPENWKNGVPNEFMTAIIPSATSVTNQPVISSYEEFLDNPAKAFDVRLEENSHLILSDHARLEIYGGLIAETGAIFDAFNIPSNSTNSEVVFYQAQAEIQSRVDVSFANLSFANTVEEVVTNYPLVVHRNFDLSKAVLSFLDDSNKNGGKDYVQIESGGAITYTEGRVVGMIRHFIQEDATGMPVQLPVGTMDNNRWVRVEYESGPGPANQGYLEARFIPFSGTYDPFTDVDDFYSNVNFSGGIPDEDLVVNTLSEQGIWHIAPMAGGDGVKNGTVSLAFSTCGIPWIIAPQDVRMVARKPGETDWKILGNHVSPDEILPDVYWINRQGIPSLGDSQNPGYLAHTYWAMGSNHEINPLPIELVSFTATCAEDAILVQWTTATETNNSHFLLERAYSDGSFELIAHIEGGGNTSQLTEYMYNDQPANDGSVIYYRLSQYDFDGQYEVFAPIALECSNVLSEGGVNVFPNPASSYVTLETISPLQTQAIAEIYTLSGVLVLQQPMEVFPGLNTQSLRIEHLQQGLYLLKVTARDVNFGTRRLYVR